VIKKRYNNRRKRTCFVGFLMNRFIYFNSGSSARQNRKKIVLIIVIIAVLLMSVVDTVRAQTGDKDRYTSKPNSVFCINLSAIQSIKSSIAQHDQKAISQLINNGKCTVSQSSLVVYVVQEEKEFVRVQQAGSSKYRWTFKNSLQ